MIDSDKRQKGEDAQRNGQCQVMFRFDLRLTGKATEVKVYRGQAPIFSTNIFIKELLAYGAQNIYFATIVFLVETDRMIPNLTLKSKGQSLT